MVGGSFPVCNFSHLAHNLPPLASSWPALPAAPTNAYQQGFAGLWGASGFLLELELPPQSELPPDSSTALGH